jgi:hypothetical protein
MEAVKIQRTIDMAEFVELREAINSAQPMESDSNPNRPSVLSSTEPSEHGVPLQKSSESPAAHLSQYSLAEALEKFHPSTEAEAHLKEEPPLPPKARRSRYFSLPNNAPAKYTTGNFLRKSIGYWRPK